MTRLLTRPTLVVFAALALVLTGCETVPAERAEAVRLVNQSRAAGGLGALSENQHLSNRAELVAQRMRDQWVAAGCPSPPRPFLTHTPNLAAHYQPQNARRNWQRLGENIGYVGVGGGNRMAAVNTLHQAYMNSPRHRDNVMGSYDLIGVGTVTGPTAAQKAAGSCPNTATNSVMWNAQVFVK